MELFFSILVPFILLIVLKCPCKQKSGKELNDFLGFTFVM